MFVVKVWLAGSLHRVDMALLTHILRASIAAEMSSPGSVRGFNRPTEHTVDLDEVVVLEISRIFQEEEALAATVEIIGKGDPNLMNGMRQRISAIDRDLRRHLKVPRDQKTLVWFNPVNSDCWH